MISHQFQCIFIHPPRVGGSSIEHAICGQGWWSIDKASKHLLASQAKERYARYWNDYFKFSFIRNPWDRCVSMLHCGSVYFGSAGNEMTPEKLRWYMEKFGFPVTLEVDYRFHDRDQLLRPCHGTGAVYGNFLDEPIDFVGRFESLEDDFGEVARTIGLRNEGLPKKASSVERSDYRRYYTDETRALVSSLYAADCQRFGYTF